MIKQFCRVSCAVVVLTAFVRQPHAVVIWNEGLSSDLSNLPGTPSAFSLSGGANSVIGTVNSETDLQDWIALTVPNGFQLSSITLAAYSSSDQTGFTGFQIGSSFQGSPFVANSYNGYTHFGPAVPNGGVGSDLLPLMDDPTDTQGFTLPLGAGAYTFVIQQFGQALTSYQFDYNITPVPEPRTHLAMALFCALAYAAHRAVPRLRPIRVGNQTQHR